MAETDRKSFSLHIKKLEDVMPLISEGLMSGHCITFSPKGHSMLPLLREGKDTVTLSSIEGEIKKYDICLYQRRDGKYILHRVVKTGDSYTCLGDNQYVLEGGLKREQFIAVVTEFTRDGNQIPITSLGYKIYCRLLYYSRPIRHFFFRVRRKLKLLFSK